MQAAVFRKPHEPLTIETVDIDKPKVTRCLSEPRRAVCATATSTWWVAMAASPSAGRMLGHEGAGVVEAVGADVTYVKPGDHIVAWLSGFCDACEQCLAGHPNLCTGGITGRGASASPRLSRRELQRGMSRGGPAVRTVRG